MCVLFRASERGKREGTLAVFMKMLRAYDGGLMCRQPARSGSWAVYPKAVVESRTLLRYLPESLPCDSAKVATKLYL